MTSVTVIAGYLGSGKTTLINHLIRQAQGRRVAILVNEFGTLGIDDALIEAVEGQVIGIAGGCVCCAYGDDLSAALDEVMQAQPSFEHILIEASGVAYPNAIMSMVGFFDGLSADAIIVVADCEQIKHNASRRYISDLIYAQLSQAQIIALSKTDVMTEQGAKEVVKWLEELAPDTPILQSKKGFLPFDALIGIGKGDAVLWQDDGHSHAQFESDILRPEGKIDAKKMAQDMANDPAIVRAKGFVATKQGMALLQIVGSRWEIQPASDDHEVAVVSIKVI
ncbi:MAG: CobW family GTP-binding protein [Candidatus Puniceispirillaceae bacterium]